MENDTFYEQNMIEHEILSLSYFLFNDSWYTWSILLWKSL